MNLPDVAKSETPEVVKLLLDLGADPNARYEYGNTPLHSAAGFNIPEVVKVLLDAGANLEARDKDGYTPLHEAATSLREDPEVVEEVVEVLLNAGADPKAKTIDGRTPVELIPDNSPLHGTDVYWQLNEARF